MSNISFAEYIWLDGAVPVRQIRSKARVVTIKTPLKPTLADFPEWSFDGSSTNQAVGHNSDCIIKPVNFVKDPVRGEGNYLVMCEVFDPEGKHPHESNSRAQLRAVLDAGAKEHDLWFGFEQEYTLFHGWNPIGWPEGGYPAPQGPYYCGVGPRQISGDARNLVEAHAQACVEAGILFYGINAEVMPGQWEFQIGYRGINGEDAGPLNVADHLWISRWLMHRISEDFDIHVSFDNKPVKGDWNGAGCHTNVSTKGTRDPKTGRKAIDEAISRLSKKHPEHIALYGDKLEERLTGAHETCSIHEFRSGDADRGSSIRIPKPVATKGYGYIEDRRPGANSDPYLVAARLATTVCNVKESVMAFRSWPRSK
ncbi:MAG: glutamine synthetase beta-grasp domain-containing protein [Alphaproteobacteria bacterium]|jgi:glutamine synthetase